MLTEALEANYHRTKRALVLRGLVGIAVGALILTRPLASIAAFALVVAMWALFDGVVNIVLAFELRDIAPHWWGRLLAGIIGVAFGVLAFYYYPFLSLSYVVLITSLWMLTTGVIGVDIAIEERRSGMRWGWMMTFGIIGILAGIGAFLNPGATLAALMVVLAWFGIIGGFAMLMGAGRMQAVEHELKRAMHA